MAHLLITVDNYKEFRIKTYKEALVDGAGIWNPSYKFWGIYFRDYNVTNVHYEPIEGSYYISVNGARMCGVNRKNIIRLDPSELIEEEKEVVSSRTIDFSFLIV